jgi:hypothetical protein
MNSLAENILEWAAGRYEGAVVCAKALLRFGSRAAVDQALSRLAKEGKLLRVARGTYVLPIEGKFGVRPPEPGKVVESLALAEGEAIVASGAAAANALGLTTQVPIRSVYVSAGRSRHLTLGAQTVEIRHVPRWQMALAGHAAGEAIRALAWLGPQNASAALQVLKNRLPPSELKLLAASGALMPSWMASAVAEILPYG